MTTVTLKGNAVAVSGSLVAQGANAADFNLVASDLSEKTLASYAGKRKVLNIFPSIDTGTCATSVRTFNQKAATLDNTVVLCISKDLPFAQKRFCGAEGIDNVEMLSAFRSSFATDYGIELKESGLKGLTARAVVVLDEANKVIHSQLVPEIVDEPNYDTALSAL